MQTGLDKISAGFDEGLAGRRVALLCNHTAVDRWGRHAVQVLRRVRDLDLVRLLSPEHGLWSTHQDMEPVAAAETRDPDFDLPVISLYGDAKDSLAPRPEAFEGVDAVVYDIQDIGVRYYTYASTLAYTMEAAAEAGVPVWVLDRPNPLGPDREGPLVQPGYESFCGVEAGLPVRHGLTVGGLARWLRSRRAPSCELHVVECDPHAARYPWVPPSPNMPTVDTAAVYGGMCFLEGTTLSEGRGTTTPFVLFGAPGVDPLALVEELRGFECPGLDWVPRRFRPEFGKHAGEVCGGAYIRVFDRTCVQAVRTGALVLEAVRRVAPDALEWRRDAYEFETDRLAIDLLWGSPDLREALEAGRGVEKLLKAAAAEAASFQP
ncbi:MAG: exo-beta-N-acetylmuramidase NamZ family protein [Myxococcota bacterium]